ncbi:MAG: radical SAM protein, partial [Candidatus Nanoarchaeia archaeon]
VYALSANFTYEANAVKEAIAALKKHNPEAMIVVGGSDASPRERHEFYFRAGADHIGIGDAEKSLPKFLEKISSGKVERDKGRLIPGEGKVSVIDLEIVARMRYDTRRFTESGGGPVLDSVARKGFVAYLEMQRGCNRTCDFCSAAETPFDHLSVEEVKRQMDNFDSQGAGLVMFTDDNLLMRRSEELREIFQYMQEKKMAWEFPNGLEFGLLNIGNSNRRRDNLVEALFWNNGDRDNYAGAHRVLIPVEDSLLRQSSLLKLRHGGQAEVLEEVIQRGVPYINLGIMIGSATETKQERKRLEGWLDRFSQFQKGPSQVNYSLFCTMPLPGTQLGRDLEAHGKIRYDINKDPELWNVFTSVIEGDNFSPEETTAYRGGLLERYGMNQRDGKVGSA